MGNQANQQQNQQVYYDPSTGQYYTMESSNKGYGYNPILDAALGRSGKKNYISMLNNNTVVPNYAAPTTPDVPSIADLFPLMNNASIINAAMAQPSQSSGAGRFISLVGDQNTGNTSTK